MNLHHKVEMAFDNLTEVLSCAADNAESRDEIMFYSDLADECIGLLDKAHRDLTDLIIKKAAPAAGTTEAAKSDSDKESTSSVAENGENVKTPYMNVRYICDGKYDVEIYATSVKELSSIYRAANDGIKGFTEQNCIPFTAVEFLADHINKEE